MSKLSDFDLDLSVGHEGESLVNELLTGGKTVEVKTDLKWKDTGNLYIEWVFHNTNICHYAIVSAKLSTGLSLYLRFVSLYLRVIHRLRYHFAMFYDTKLPVFG